MRNSLDGLRHHAVIRGDHQDDEIGHFGAAGAHRRKGSMARCVKEGNLRARGKLHLIRADMLRNATCFASGDVSLAQCIQQRSLAVVDVPHHGHDRRPCDEFLLQVSVATKTFEHVRFGNTLDGVPQFRGDEFGRIGIDGVIGRRHHAALHQHFDDIDAAARHAVCQFRNRNGFGNDHFARSGRRWGLMLSVRPVQLPPE